MPHLPLELQMIIIKDCIELYRQDEKNSSSSSSSAAKKQQQQQSTSGSGSAVAAATRLAQIVGMELEVMEAEEREEITGGMGSGPKSWEVVVGNGGGAFAKFVEGDRSADEEVEERSRWGLALVSKTVSLASFFLFVVSSISILSRTRSASLLTLSFFWSQWNEISLPLLYRNIQLSQPASYTILARLLTSPPSSSSTSFGPPPVAKWIKRAVLREVPPTAWLDPTSDVGKVIGSLKDLEIFKVRYRARIEGEEDVVGGVSMRDRGQKEMWEAYPGVNPKV